MSSQIRISAVEQTCKIHFYKVVIPQRLCYNQLTHLNLEDGNYCSYVIIWGIYISSICLKEASKFGLVANITKTQDVTLNTRHGSDLLTEHSTPHGHHSSSLPFIKSDLQYDSESQTPVLVCSHTLGLQALLPQTDKGKQQQTSLLLQVCVFTLKQPALTKGKV